MEIILADLRNSTHAEAVVVMLDIYAQDPMGGDCALSSYTKENLISELSLRGHCYCFLALEGDVPAGFAITFESFSTFKCRPILNIHDFAVSPNFRGMGVAHKLLEKVESYARELGCCKLTLEVLEGNSRAQKVYGDFGFRGYELNPELGRAMFLEKPF